MSYSIPTGFAISTDGGSTWSYLTDHNRKHIQSSPTLIEKSARMANGTLRKYVIANKQVFSTSWEFTPSLATQCVDYTQHNGTPVVSSAWLSAFYRVNAGLPIKLRVFMSSDTLPSAGSLPNDGTYQTSRTSYTDYNVFISKYSSTTTHRNVVTDYVNMDIEFTEI